MPHQSSEHVVSITSTSSNFLQVWRSMPPWVYNADGTFAANPAFLQPPTSPTRPQQPFGQGCTGSMHAQSAESGDSSCHVMQSDEQGLAAVAGAVLWGLVCRCLAKDPGLRPNAEQVCKRYPLVSTTRVSYRMLLMCVPTCCHHHRYACRVSNNHVEQHSVPTKTQVTL